MAGGTASRVISACVLVASFAAGGEAQEVAGSFDQLRVLVKPGDTVSVTDATGQEARGAISDLSSSALAITVGGSRRRFLERDIDAIRQRRPDSLANGAKWGLAVGAGLGLLAGIAIASEYDGGGGPLIPMLSLTYGALGAGVGAGIDALVSSEQVIFARRGSPSAVAVRPVLKRGRTGIAATIGF